MTKTTRSFTVDLEAFISAKATGLNLSQEVTKLFYDLGKGGRAEWNEQIPRGELIRIIKDLDDYPIRDEFWSKNIRRKYHVIVSPYDLMKFVREKGPGLLAEISMENR